MKETLSAAEMLSATKSVWAFEGLVESAVCVCVCVCVCVGSRWEGRGGCFTHFQAWTCTDGTPAPHSVFLCKAMLLPFKTIFTINLDPSVFWILSPSPSFCLRLCSDYSSPLDRIFLFSLNPSLVFNRQEQDCVGYVCLCVCLGCFCGDSAEKLTVKGI